MTIIPEESIVPQTCEKIVHHLVIEEVVTSNVVMRERIQEVQRMIEQHAPMLQTMVEEVYVPTIIQEE